VPGAPRRARRHRPLRTRGAEKPPLAAAHRPSPPPRPGIPYSGDGLLRATPIGSAGLDVTTGQGDTSGNMDRAVLDGVELEYEIRGAGEPVVLAHHGAGPDWFGPLLEEPALTRRHRLLRYHRAGYAGSSPLVPPLTFAGEAVVFRALMFHLGLDRVHVVGHSASGCIALQFALDVPDVVRSVALLEAALLVVPSPAEVPRALELYRTGDTITAVDTFLRGTCGPHYRAILEKAIPDAVGQAVADAGTFFGHEL